MCLFHSVCLYINVSATSKTKPDGVCGQLACVAGFHKALANCKVRINWVVHEGEAYNAMNYRGVL